MFRRYNRWHSRFDQPDPYGGSYDPADPQSFNRYSYTQGDPVNFTDPTGLCTWAIDPATGLPFCVPDLPGEDGGTVSAGGSGMIGGGGGARGGHPPLLDAGVSDKGGPNNPFKCITGNWLMNHEGIRAEFDYL